MGCLVCERELGETESWNKPSDVKVNLKISGLESESSKEQNVIKSGYVEIDDQKNQPTLSDV